MTNLNFDDLRWLHLLWAVLATTLVGLFGVWARRRALRRFATTTLLPRLTAPAGWARPIIRLTLIVVALCALVAALIGPRWGEQTQSMFRRNIDIMILLDVSRSMLAEDIAPNRLERAKLAIRDDLLPSLGGDRIGLITFAGQTAVACPLTTDYGFFRLALDDVTTRSAARGGTLIGDAIRKAGELSAKDDVDTHRIIVLITDGEDHESFPVEAAAGVWKDQHIPVIALALGDSEQGARIPIAGSHGREYVTQGGEYHWSKADFAALEKVARASSQGVFVAVGTSNFDLGAIYRQVAQGVRFDEDQEERHARQPTRYHPFALLALLLVLVDSFLRAAPAAANGGQHVAADPRVGRPQPERIE